MGGVSDSSFPSSWDIASQRQELCKKRQRRKVDCGEMLTGGCRTEFPRLRVDTERILRSIPSDGIGSAERKELQQLPDDTSAMLVLGWLGVMTLKDIRVRPS